MKTTAITVIGTRGANRRPSMGYATFDDGGYYDWMVLPEGGIRFFGQRRRAHGGIETVSFASPKRAAALAAALEI